MRGKISLQEKFMKAALKEAQKAYLIDEVPIGCVIVKEDKIIARGYNRRNIDKNTLAHAELTAIRKASKKTGDWRLEECTMYVVIGAMNPKAGCAGSVLNLLQVPKFNHQVELECGILEEECAAMLREFFAELRRKKKEN